MSRSFFKNIQGSGGTVDFRKILFEGFKISYTSYKRFKFP
jgi:hypothetical protein